MASGIGPSPFNGNSVNVGNQTEADALKAYYKENRGRRKVHYDDNGLAVNAGFMRKVGTNARGAKGTTYKPPMRTLTDSKGNTYQTPDVVKWDDWLDMFRAQGSDVTEFYENDPKWKNCQSLADMVDYAFNVTPKKDKIFSVSCPKGSHIERMDYAQNFCGILRVYFRGGNVVCYFYVPKGVWGTLCALAENGGTRPGVDGKDRHLVGIYFWNLIRIRGTVHGNRFRCCYVEGGGGYTPRDVKSETDYNRHEIAAINAMKKEEASLRSEGQKEAADRLAEEIERAENGLHMVTKRSQLTPGQMAHRDNLRHYYKEDPDRPLSAMMIRLSKGGKSRSAVLSSIPALHNNVNMTIAYIKKKGESLRGNAGKEFAEAGKRMDGDTDEYDAYLRQENVLVKYNLWPWYK